MSIYIASKLIFLVVVLLKATASQAENCTKCENLPPDCRVGNKPPARGGPPCTCSNGVALLGCILKPCAHDPTPFEICDCSTGDSDTRGTCMKFRCYGDSGTCESCQGQSPPDCIGINLITSPANGGPECSCAWTHPLPSGCTMRRCMTNPKSPTYCICNPNVIDPGQSLCYGARCPGSNSTESRWEYESHSTLLSDASSGSNSQCPTMPLKDCDPYELSPWKGGPLCLCTNKAPHQGCVLKPCLDVNSTNDLCDSTAGHGHGKKFAFAHLSGNGTQFPVDCEAYNYVGPPAEGGPPCSCHGGYAPRGCTMKPCEDSPNPVPCLCKTGWSGKSYCFSYKCSGAALLDRDDGNGHSLNPDVDNYTTIRTAADDGGISSASYCRPKMIIGVAVLEIFVALSAVVINPVLHI